MPYISKLLAKITKGTTQVFVTISWEGTGSSDVMVETPAGTFTEERIPMYQKTSYSTSASTTKMLNIKRLSIIVTTLNLDENWRVILDFDDVEKYNISVEHHK